MQILWAAILTLWVIWFVGRRREIERLASQLNPSVLPTDETSVVVLIVVGIVMLSLLGAGTIMLFAWGQRQSSLIQQQRTFVSSVTHELRTPLASIHLAYETLTRRELPEATKKQLLGMSLIDIERLMRLVNQILISSRLDRGLSMFKDDIRDNRISESIKSILGTLTHLDAKIHERLQIICEQDLVWHGSQNAFNIILGNLIENAIKYSPPKAPIAVAALRGPTQLTITVSDKGLGLTKRDRKKIFKMFYRGGDARTRAIPGTGLGLFIVKTTVEQLGGSIHVESTGLGEGSTFKVILPA
jgi:signal transduction histidine kinase